MNLLELRNAARLELDDPDTGVDNRDLLWSDEELDRWINEAEREATRRAYLLRDDSVLITTSTATNAYAVPVNVLRILSAKQQGSLTGELKELTEAQVRTGFPQWGTQLGNPTRFYQQGLSISLDRRPSSVAPLVVSAYIPMPNTDMVNDTDEPEIPYQYHDALINWVAHKAYKKKDAETYDLDLSRSSKAAFNEDFGRKRTAVEEQVIRTEQPRRVRGQYL